ncbi:MAG: sigma-54-dependent Fis family transcriptional regulator [Bauldia sp.]|nr:sigma-54-dependent Fis family transcriptional regulator [Bauldia sp.]
MSTAVLIVDDDPVQRRLLAHAVQRLGYRPLAAANGREALFHLATADGDAISLVILDCTAPADDGMAVLSRLRDEERGIPVIVQAGQGDMDAVSRALRAGAVDFVVKPATSERLQVSIENALKLGALESELQRIKRVAAGTLTFDDMVNRSPAMERVLGLARRAAVSQIPVLIEGEPGVGKELIARAIHGSGERKARAFLAFNCAASLAGPFDTVLFGHEKGALGGSGDRRSGKFRDAEKGTLLLDEVGTLPPAIQARLVRFLEDGEIEPPGARKPLRVDVRLIATTTRSLIDLVKEGRFREDLYYRMNVFPIRMPALRERREDIAELVRHFAARFAAEEGKAFVRGVSAEALELLLRYDWPGNVRQLENTVFRAVALAEGAWLTPAEFPQVVHQVEGAAPLAGAGLRLVPEAGGEVAFDEAGDVRPLAEVEARMIRLAITRYEGRMTEVARKLGIGRSTLYRKLKELGLDAGVTEDIAAA